MINLSNLSNYYHKVFKLKEPSFILIRNCQNLTNSQDSIQNKNDKFKKLIKEGPSLGDFIESSSINRYRNLKLKREDDEPR